MSKLKTFVAVLMLVFVLGLAAPQALAGDMNEPPGETNAPPGETQGPPSFADWASVLVQIFGQTWSV